jgi:YesN/AraC family two-component response regulator
MKKRAKAKQRVLIVDDHPMMRQGLAQLINHEPDLRTCGEADTVAQALKRISADKPDLVLADISLPDRSGLELIKDA